MIYLTSGSGQIMLAYLISGMTYGFAAAVSPGPLAMYLMSQAVSRGWRKALPVAFSPLVTDGPVAVLVLAILSRVPAGLVSYLRLAGGALLLYLAYEAWKAWRNFEAAEGAAAGKTPNSLLRAIWINWLNPNLYIGWSVILGPMVLGGWRRSPGSGISVIVGFYATIVTVMAVMAAVFGAARVLGPRARRNLVGASVFALIGLGFYQLWAGGRAIF